MGSKLTLQEVKEICEADESAQKKCAAITSSSSLNFLRKNTSSYKKNAAHCAMGECKFCGRRHELKKECCPAFGKTCSKCQGKNHFAVKCRKAKPLVQKPALGCLMASISSNASLVDVSLQAQKMEPRKVKMLADTGADICAMPSSALTKKLKLRRCWARPKTAGGQLMNVSGVFNANLCIGDANHST